MTVYIYKVRDKAGKLIAGEMEAVDAPEFRKKLDTKGWFIVEYSEKEAKKMVDLAKLISIQPRVNFKVVSVFTWQLYTMLNAGLPLVQSLKTIERQLKNVKLKSVILDVAQRVEKGSALSDALSKHPSVFSQLYVQMVSAGEVGGVLDEILRSLANYLETQSVIHSKIKSALIYPIVLIMATMGVTIFLVTYVLPKFALVFSDIGVATPLPTQLLLSLSDMLIQKWYVFLILTVAGIFTFISYLRTKMGRYYFDQYALRVPIIGDLIRKAIAVQFTQTLSTMVSAGIPILTALDVVKSTIRNTYVTKVLEDVSVWVGEGKSIARPLEESKIFPEMVINMIHVGEETGSLDKMLSKVADFYNREVDSAIDAFTKLIEPVLIVIMTVVIGFITTAIFLPMADIMQGLHQ